jgi:hypothetical protein
MIETLLITSLFRLSDAVDASSRCARSTRLLDVEADTPATIVRGTIGRRRTLRKSLPPEKANHKVAAPEKAAAIADAESTLVRAAATLSP